LKKAVKGAGSMFKSKEQFKRNFVQNFEQMHGKDINAATADSVYQTLGMMVRNEVAAQWISTNRFYRENEAKEVYYFFDGVSAWPAARE